MLPLLDRLFCLAEHELNLARVLFYSSNEAPSKFDPRVIFKKVSLDLCLHTTSLLEDLSADLKDEVTLKQRQFLEEVCESIDQNMKEAVKVWLKVREMQRFGDVYKVI